jgi:site-specific recombinase XerD
MTSPGGQTWPIEILTPDEVRQLIRACSAKAPTGIRNRALISLLYRSGLRIGEALALFPKDVDVKEGTVTVLHGKGDRRRTTGIDPGALAMVEEWLKARERLGISRRRRIFCTLAGQPLDDSYIRHLLPRLAAKAAVDKRVHAHGLRHTHASELAKEGVPMNLLQAQLGHASLATTDRYVRHIAPHELVEAMRQRTWQA